MHESGNQDREQRGPDHVSGDDPHRDSIPPVARENDVANRVTGGRSDEDSPTPCNSFFLGEDHLPDSGSRSASAVTWTIESNPNGNGGTLRPFCAIGDYELLERVAKGGMGVVYKARQVSLNRIVAFKTIRDGRLSSPAQIERFRTEAHAAAALHHPNIIPVYEFGEIEGIHFFTMEFVEGQSLAARVCEGASDPVNAAGYLHEIARTIAYAHRRGFIHRDLKPSNILIDSAGRTRVTDFGLVKPIASDKDLTVEGALLGTPSYMAPELTLSNRNATTASDVYSLGGILYSLLTGRPPFQAENEFDTLIQVRTKAPVTPTLLNNRIPPDLETICLKCLAKEPSLRYPTADSLADDLERFLAGKPISARSVQPWERLWRWSRRNPLQAVSALLAVVLIGIWIFTLTMANARLNKLNDRLSAANSQLNDARAISAASASHAEKLQVEAESHRRKAEELLYVSDMQQAGNAWRDGDVRRLTELLARHQPTNEADGYQGGEWHFLSQRTRAMPCRLIARGEQPTYFVCYSPNGRYVATAGKDAVIRIYERATSAVTFSIVTRQIEVNGLAFSPDGSTLASAGDDGTVRLWGLDWTNRVARPVRSIKAHDHQAFNVLFTPDGRTLVSAGRDTIIRIWDAATGRSIGTLAGHRDTAGSIAMHPDGKLLVSAGHDGDLIVWNLESRSIARRVTADGTSLLSVTLSPDGQLVAVSSSTRDIFFWRIPSCELVRKLEHLDQVQCVKFLPDAKSIIVCDQSGTIRTWPVAGDGPVATRRTHLAELRAWKAHRDRIHSIALSNDFRELISAGDDGRVVAWNLIDDRLSTELRKPDADIADMRFIPGSNLLALNDGQVVELWDGKMLRRTRAFGRIDGKLNCLSPSSDGSTLVAGGMGGIVRVYNLRGGGSETQRDIRRDFNVRGIAVSPDGSVVAAVDRYNSDKHDDLYVMETRTGTRLSQIRAKECNSAAFSPDGRWLFASGPANVISVWEVRTQKKVCEQSGHASSINSIEFEPQSRWVATASDDRLVKIWNTRDWRAPFVLNGARTPLNCVTISADGRTLATSGSDGVLTFWHTATEEDLFQELFEIDFAPAYPERLSFSTDGRLLACLLNGAPGDSGRRFIRIMNWDNVDRHSSSE